MVKMAKPGPERRMERIHLGLRGCSRRELLEIEEKCTSLRYNTPSTAAVNPLQQACSYREWGEFGNTRKESGRISQVARILR
jgi:hypothetical protein